MEEPFGLRPHLKEDMVERVADAIIACGDPVSQDWDAWRIKIGRAAIAAMREPTGAMLHAASVESEGDYAVPSAYRAMIDAALQGPEGAGSP